MGMSASQARLIALTARMSDTEYEAQQINQQRLTISNQMNAVYEAMCNMEVPTPPSKLDPQYMKTVYKGKQGGTDVSVSTNNDGTISAYNSVFGDVVKTAGHKQVGSVEKPENYVLKSPEYKAENFKQWDLTKATENYQGTFKVKLTEEVQVDLTETSVQPKGEAFEKTFSSTSLDALKAIQANGNYTDDGTTYYIVEVPQEADYVKTYTSTEFEGSKTEAEITQHNADVIELSREKFVKQNADGTFDLVEPKDIKDGDVVYECSNATKFSQSREAQKRGIDEGQTTIAGNPVMTLSVAEATYGSLPGFSNALNGLKHTFADNDAWENFSAIIGTDDKGNYTFSFCMTEDINNGDDSVQVWQYAQDDYDEFIGNLSPDEVTFDANGNISSAVINGQNVPMSLEHVVDEYAYEAAMNQYNSDKAVYDQEQNRLNHQTSIYQRQDKMLELKLTRLDNERNALNTEIEAVKKVIQDAIDRGFKTFSG